MKTKLLIAAFIIASLTVSGQQSKTNNIRFIGGLSIPELIHAGLTYRLSNSHLIGLNAGVFIEPFFGYSETTISFEHRFYLGKNNQNTNYKTWFFRQGITYLPNEAGLYDDIQYKQLTLNLTAGKDIPFKNSNSGITIDAGLVQFQWLAIRFELYF